MALSPTGTSSNCTPGRAEISLLPVHASFFCKLIMQITVSNLLPWPFNFCKEFFNFILSHGTNQASLGINVNLEFCKVTSHSEKLNWKLKSNVINRFTNRFLEVGYWGFPICVKKSDLYNMPKWYGDSAWLRRLKIYEARGPDRQSYWRANIFCFGALRLCLKHKIIVTQ